MDGALSSNARNRLCCSLVSGTLVGRARGLSSFRLSHSGCRRLERFLKTRAIFSDEMFSPLPSHLLWTFLLVSLLFFEFFFPFQFTYSVLRISMISPWSTSTTPCKPRNKLVPTLSRIVSSSFFLFLHLSREIAIFWLRYLSPCISAKRINFPRLPNLDF